MFLRWEDTCWAIDVDNEEVRGLVEDERYLIAEDWFSVSQGAQKSENLLRRAMM